MAPSSTYMPSSSCTGGDEGSAGFLLRTADDVAALAPKKRRGRVPRSVMLPFAARGSNRGGGRGGMMDQRMMQAGPFGGGYAYMAQPHGGPGAMRAFHQTGHGHGFAPY